ncbi:MAG: hypothetical protein R6V57_11580 [Vicinamibacterales bacterium]
MGLTNLWRDRDADVEARRRAVAREDDEAVLVECACRDADLETRRLAVDRIANASGWRSVALNGQHLDARLRAVEHIDDPWTLADIVRQRKNRDLMLACMARITNQQVLALIAKDAGYNIATRRLAVQMFSEPALLAEVLSGLAEPGLRQALGDKAGAGPMLPPPPPDPAEVEARVDRLLQTYDPEVLVEALHAFRDSLGAVGALGVLCRREGPAAPRALELLVRLLRHPRADIRVRAVEALANRAGDCRDELQNAASSDADPRVREAAARAVSADSSSS